MFDWKSLKLLALLDIEWGNFKEAEEILLDVGAYFFEQQEYQILELNFYNGNHNLLLLSLCYLVGNKYKEAWNLLEKIEDFRFDN